MDELRVSNSAIEAVILPELGARLHRLRAFGYDVLRTPSEPLTHAGDPFFWGAYVMAPWCNRVAPGVVAVGSRDMTLTSNFRDGSAIHGQVHSRAWERRGPGVLGVRGGADDWPWEYDVRLGVRIVDQSLHLALSLTNLSTSRMPAGIGLHPWFRRPVLVAIRGDAVYPRNAGTQPHPEPVAGPFDLRAVGEMASGLDATWTRLAEPAVELRWPGAGLRATMHIASRAVCVVAASPGDVDALAIEPETHAPDGIRRLLSNEPDAMALLDPGETLDLEIELAFERTTTSVAETGGWKPPTGS